MLSSRQRTRFITITALALVQCLNVYLKPGYYNAKQLLANEVSHQMNNDLKIDIQNN